MRTNGDWLPFRRGGTARPMRGNMGWQTQGSQVRDDVSGQTYEETPSGKAGGKGALRKSDSEMLSTSHEGAGLNGLTSRSVGVVEMRGILEGALLSGDPSSRLWGLVDSGWADRIVPELPALRLEQDPVHRHKDVLSHTIAVTAKTSPSLTLRLAALFHDIGKPATRSYERGKVTFYHHEAVGARITRRRLTALEYPPALVDDIAELVRLSGRFKGFAGGWSDSAVRRYARDAGHLLGHLNELVRCDCTTRNRAAAAELQCLVDALEARIEDLALADRRAAERPLIDGNAVMRHLALPPGPKVGEALSFLLDLRRSNPELGEDETLKRLSHWWEEHR